MKIYRLTTDEGNNVYLYITATNEAIYIGDNELSNVRVDSVEMGDEHPDEMYITMAGEYYDTEEGVLDALFHVLEYYNIPDGTLKEVNI